MVGKLNDGRDGSNARSIAEPTAQDKRHHMSRQLHAHPGIKKKEKSIKLEAMIASEEAETLKAYNANAIFHVHAGSLPVLLSRRIKRQSRLPPGDKALPATHA